MIYPNDFHRDEYDQEVLDMMRQDFPCICKVTHAREVPSKRYDWHWHSVFEVDFIGKGVHCIHSSGETTRLRCGELCFINQNVVHEVYFNEDLDTDIYIIFFDTDFLFGNHRSFLEQKYVTPILESTLLQVYPFRTDNCIHLEMTDAIMKAIDLFRREPEGYELLIHEQILRFWRGLFFATADLRAQDNGGITDSARIRPMLSYILENLSSPITADDIAAAGSISTRECSRLFRRCIGTSPVHYLNGQRLRYAESLLRDNRHSIAEISDLCGFSSPSYFSRAFTKETGQSPREFRQTSMGLQQPSMKCQQPSL